MEIRVVRRTDAELYHWGIKGMKWGQRRYQNKDGSLTPAGEKRYNKELERVKKEKAKLDEKARIEKNKAKTQAKWDKLEEMKRKNQEQRDALSGKTKKGDADKNPKSDEDSLEARREKLLKSTNAKELYKNKDILTDAEINERINRIDLEQKLSNRIVKEPSAFDKTIEKTDRMITAYKKVDEVYSTVANSAIGKTLAKKLGVDIEPKKKAWDWDKVKKNLDKMSNEEISDAAKRKKNEDTILGKNKDDDNQNQNNGNQNQNNGNQNQNKNPNKNDSNNQNSNSNNDRDKNAGKKDAGKNDKTNDNSNIQDSNKNDKTNSQSSKQTGDKGSTKSDMYVKGGKDYVNKSIDDYDSVWMPGNSSNNKSGNNKSDMYVKGGKDYVNKSIDDYDSVWMPGNKDDD